MSLQIQTFDPDESSGQNETFNFFLKLFFPQSETIKTIERARLESGNALHPGSFNEHNLLL